MADASARLEYIEEHGLRTAEFHLRMLEGMNQQAQKLLSLLIVSIGASLGYFFRLVETSASSAWVFGVAALAVYLAGIATYLVWGCLSTTAAWPATNIPREMKKEPGTVTEIREAEIEHIQFRVDKNRQRNEEIGGRLNYAQYAIAGAPVFFLLMWGAAATVA